MYFKYIPKGLPHLRVARRHTGNDVPHVDGLHHYTPSYVCGNIQSHSMWDRVDPHDKWPTPAGL